MELHENKKDVLIAVGAVVAAAFFVIAIKNHSSSAAATQAAASAAIQPVYNTAAETVTVPANSYNITYNTQTTTTTNTINGAPTTAAGTITTPAAPTAPQVTTQAPTATPINPAPAAIPKTTGQLAINNNYDGTYHVPASQTNNSGVTTNQNLWGQSNPNYNASQPQSASNPAAYSSTGIAETIAGSNSSDPGAVGYYSTHDPNTGFDVQGTPNTGSYKAYTTWNGKHGYWDENGDFHSDDGTIG